MFYSTGPWSGAQHRLIEGNQSQIKISLAVTVLVGGDFKAEYFFVEAAHARN
jgi:hypothetical protein